VTGGGVHPGDAERLSVVVGRINRRIRANADGLSYGLTSTLSSIVRLGETRASDLARIEVVTAPSMTRILADLEQRGLIARHDDPDDRRATVVIPTDLGVATLLRARAERASRVGEALSKLGERDRERLVDALDALERLAIRVDEAAAGL